MEVNDNEFDAAFRRKVFDAEPRFEEAAWNRMEQKLRRRDRVVFFRKAGALCLLLLMCFGGYQIFNQPSSQKGQTLVIKKNKQERRVVTSPKGNDRGNQGADVVVFAEDRSIAIPVIKVPKKNYTIPVKNIFIGKEGMVALVDSMRQEKVVVMADTVSIKTARIVDVEPDMEQELAENKKQKSGKRKAAWPMRLSLSAGPEFNSSGAMLGGKTGFNAGLGFSVSIAKHITLQTGLRYSRKDYTAESAAYQFRRPGTAAVISSVDASCAVLEVPVQAAYTLLDDVHKSIDLNMGLSSYFMLKEDYTYRYKEGTGLTDRFVAYSNQNQHYFGVAEISATYYLKLKKKGLQVGLEPYVKIPLTGVGEGKVKLNSSGMSLKLRYDLRKKNY